MNVEKLSATDRVFFDIEGGALMMHLGAVLIFEGGDLVSPVGALDAARLTRLLEAGIGEVPRFRQVVREVPGLGAVWVDDARYRIGYHVRHAAIPQPGDDAQLMQTAGRVFAQPLDRRHPLWEVWLIEGLSRGRFAMIFKVHHAMVDGVAGIGLLASLLRVVPGDDPRAPAPWTPRPAPGTLEIVTALAADSARSVAHALHDLRGSFGDGGAHARDIVGGLVETLREGLVPASPSSINPSEVGPHRAYMGTRIDLARAKAVRAALGGTLNDVALAVVTGALRRYLARRGDEVDSLREFRALVPVDLRARQGDEGSGNHISLVLVPLPLREADVKARYDAVHRASEHLKHASHEVEGAAFIERIGDLGGPNIVSAVFRIASMLRAFNVTITNVPGPQMPLYVGRAELTAIHAVVPLFTHQGVGVAIVSYNGGMFIGLYADPDAVPDVEALATDVHAAFDELCVVAGC
ncbi:MAG: wax ester/triacylglycerol synthase family O-acyltransferase [Deltaproteobacteria bacterium]|nr:wax ester/triacylglycerol synthase family O-acyltransferase [Myxococcales bacterium]MDP3215419.1 wax ester/triacylglycerol synthase family O-acyltransferase [Deltaproteobacteria bacterium]